MHISWCDGAANEKYNVKSTEEVSLRKHDGYISILIQDSADGWETRDAIRLTDTVYIGHLEDGDDFVVHLTHWKLKCWIWGPSLTGESGRQVVGGWTADD